MYLIFPSWVQHRVLKQKMSYPRREATDIRQGTYILITVVVGLRVPSMDVTSNISRIEMRRAFAALPKGTVIV